MHLARRTASPQSATLQTLVAWTSRSVPDRAASMRPLVVPDRQHRRSRTAEGRATAGTAQREDDSLLALGERVVEDRNLKALAAALTIGPGQDTADRFEITPRGRRPSGYGVGDAHRSGRAAAALDLNRRHARALGDRIARLREREGSGVEHERSVTSVVERFVAPDRVIVKLAEDRGGALHDDLHPRTGPVDADVRALRREAGVASSPPDIGVFQRAAARVSGEKIRGDAARRVIDP